MSAEQSTENARCKHCALALRSDGHGSHVHAEGLQEGLTRCAADPYGFNAELVGTECGRTCNGARGIEPTRVYPPEPEVCTCGTWDDRLSAHAPDCAAQVFPPGPATS